MHLRVSPAPATSRKRCNHCANLCVFFARFQFCFCRTAALLLFVFLFRRVLCNGNRPPFCTRCFAVVTAGQNNNNNAEPLRITCCVLLLDTLYCSRWVEGEAELGTDVTTQSEHRSEHLSSRPTKGRRKLEGRTKKKVCEERQREKTKRSTIDDDGEREENQRKPTKRIVCTASHK